ncbi:MAG TPA: hypothetical protein VMW15_07255 [Terracidiphilus sp.]|nr:hypothetical protein [Terracidiphilus sp.]
MRVSQAETAIDCWHGHVVPNLAHGQYETILSVMREGCDYSLTELAELTGMRNSTLSGRCHELRNKSTGLLGSTWNKQHKCYQAKIQADKVRHHLGYFSNPLEAHKAYMEAKDHLHIQGVGN